MNDNSGFASETMTDFADFADSIPNLRLCLNSQVILEVKNARLYRAKNQQEQDSVLLSFELDWRQYKNIETHKWFRFDPIIRGKMSGKKFITNNDVAITLLLDPDMIQIFTQLQNPSENLSLTWQKLSQENISHPLFDAENWLLLSAYQQRPDGKTGYRTAWDYLNWQAIGSESDFDKAILDGIVDFLQDSLTPELKENGKIKHQSKQSSKEQLLGQSRPDLLSGDSTVINQLINEIVTLLQEPLNHSLSSQIEQTLTDESITNYQPPLLEAMIRFFQQKQWSFTQIDNQPIIYLQFQGENGQWSCFAFVQQESEQVIFYSVLEEKVPEEKRLLMAEFICHVNYGLPVGNFELNFADGELRCKTSLQTTGISLNSTLIEQFVYNNFLLMDRYIRGFQLVIHSLTPLQNILNQIEELG